MNNERPVQGASVTDVSTTRPSSILLALDSVHRSLLFNNLKYENVKYAIPETTTRMQPNSLQMKKPKRLPIPNTISNMDEEEYKAYNYRLSDARSTRSSSSKSSSEFIQCVSSSSSCYKNSDESENDSKRSPILTENSNDVPMLEIIQEITESRIVTSTVRINREKVNRFTKSTNTTPECKYRHAKESKRKKKSKQNIINDNVCNEILDKTIKDSKVQQSPPAKSQEFQQKSEILKTGKLEAIPKHSRNGGKLLAKRMQRYSTTNLTLKKKGSSIPPAKPPRTFTHTATNSPCSSKLNSSMDCGTMSSTTMVIGDLNSIAHKPKVARKLGWKLIPDADNTILPTPSCPALGDITPTNLTPLHQPTKQNIGWIETMPYKNSNIDNPVHIISMLHFDNKLPNHQIISTNLLPQSQQPVCNKEDIDTVDSPPAIRQSRNLERFSTDTVFSTPQRKNNEQPAIGPAEMDENICKQCQSKKSDQVPFRKSFGKVALKRTKTFLEASRNILNRSARNISPAQGDDMSGEEVSFSTPKKSEYTFQLNQEAMNTNNKPCEKLLGLTPPQSSLIKIDNTKHDSPKRICEQFLTAVKRTPPKKPERKSLQRTEKLQSPVEPSPQPKAFDFKRVINPPKTRNRDAFVQHLKQLSPKRLFKNQRCQSVSCLNSIDNKHARDSMPMYYKSFVDADPDADDGFVIFMAEYLRKMSLKIEADNNEKQPTLVRSHSTSSDILDVRSNRLAEIDFHREPEPIYSEIIDFSKTPNVIPIYATVNRKLKVLKPVADQTILDETKNGSQESLFNSESIDLCASIENFLEQQNIAKHTVKVDAEIVVPTREDEQLQKSANLPDTKKPAQQEIYEEISFFDDIEPYGSVGMSSIGLTSSICDEVQNGNRINDEIANTMNQMEQLELMTDNNRFAQASPESDGLGDDDVGNHSKFLYPISNVMENSQISSQKISAKKQPTYTQIKETLRNSFRRGSSFFRLEKSPKSKPADDSSKPVATPMSIQLPDPNMLHLKNKIAYQAAIREQLVNVSEICRTNLKCSSELVEAERLLLLSDKKKTIAESELIRLNYVDNEDLSESLNQIGSVTVEIRRLEFLVKRAEMINTAYKFYYVCLCSCRDRVMATYALEQCTNDDTVVFKDMKMTFSQLNQQFEIKVELFLLRLASRSASGINCVPSKLSPNETLRKATGAESCNDLDTSRFLLQGTGIICASVLWSASEYPEGSPESLICTTATSSEAKFSSAGRKRVIFKHRNKSESDEMLLDYYSEIHLNKPQLKGFLFVKGDDDPHWHRRWCWIRGFTLFMSPINITAADLRISAAILSIDLTKCMNEHFEVVNPNRSSDGKVMIIIECFNQDADDGSQRIAKYSIACQNVSDLKIWKRELNRLLQFINDWHI